MHTIYPAGPQSVPADLTSATPRYKRHAWIATAAPIDANWSGDMLLVQPGIGDAPA